MKKRTPEEEAEYEYWKNEWMRTGNTGQMQAQENKFYKELPRSRFKETVRVIGLILLILVICAAVPFVVILISAVLASKGVTI